jgi:hypothetical protein
MNSRVCDYGMKVQLEYRHRTQSTVRYLHYALRQLVSLSSLLVYYLHLCSFFQVAAFHEVCPIKFCTSVSPCYVGSLVPTAWRVLGLRMEERPPDMEVSCEYVE